MDVTLTKTRAGYVPGDPEAEEWDKTVKLGNSVRGSFTKVRNIKFLRKYMALLNLGYDAWEPGEIDSKYGTPQKNFDRFRKDIAILCGFYDIVVRLDGTTRPEAKSISFAKMEEETFSDLYSKTIDVLLKNVYGGSMSAEELDGLVDRYLQFT